MAVTPSLSFPQTEIQTRSSSYQTSNLISNLTLPYFFYIFATDDIAREEEFLCYHCHSQGRFLDALNTPRFEVMIAFFCRLYRVVLSYNYRL